MSFVELNRGYALFDYSQGRVKLHFHLGETVQYDMRSLAAGCEGRNVLLTDGASTRPVPFKSDRDRDVFLNGLRKGGVAVSGAPVQTPPAPDGGVALGGGPLSRYPLRHPAGGGGAHGSSGTLNRAGGGTPNPYGSSSSSSIHAGASSSAGAYPYLRDIRSILEDTDEAARRRQERERMDAQLRAQRQRADELGQQREDMARRRSAEEAARRQQEQELQDAYDVRLEQAERAREARERERREKDLLEQQARREREEKERELRRAAELRQQQERAKEEELRRIQRAREREEEERAERALQEAQAESAAMPTSAEDEDEMLRRAIALSLQESNGGTEAAASSAAASPPSSAVNLEPLTERELEDFTETKELGQGGQGVLFLCKTASNKPFVLKRIKCKTQDEKNDFYHRALDFQFNVLHAGIIEYYNVSEDPSDPLTVVIQMPWYSEKDLEFFINEAPRGGIDQRVIVDYTRQIAATLRYLHSLVVKRNGKSMPMVHRDLKPANILMTDQKRRCILIDFDSWGRTGKNNIAGTEEYTAPERLGDDGEAAPASDVWSLGAILFILLALPDYPMLEDPRDASNVYFLNHEYWATPGVLRQAIERKVPEKYDQEIVELCIQMLRADPRRRPTAAEVERRCKDLLK
eukprot:TRINITY_DN387_c0_g3_i3.p1 TRINITY_DN387_c0_g3~~TRINITY_DN387_c0_g3_i3.p1  ORF type:complete len:677 (+),score=259.87 TRINITY_DN387_c0_g3_i3:112-2031(+)